MNLTLDRTDVAGKVKIFSIVHETTESLSTQRKRKKEEKEDKN